jgi:hypothetical protein
MGTVSSPPGTDEVIEDEKDMFMIEAGKSPNHLFVRILQGSTTDHASCCTVVYKIYAICQIDSYSSAMLLMLDDDAFVFNEVGGRL